VTENEVLLAKQEIEFARFLEKGHDVSPAKTEAVNQARKTPLGVREAADEIETVGQLLEAAKMACGDPRPTRSAPCERFSRLLWCIARPGPGTKEMSASSSRPHQWPASTFRPGRLALCGRCFASPQGSLARPRPGSRPRMTRRPSSAFLGVLSASILRVGAARQMLGRQRPDRSRPGDLEGGEELPLNRTRAGRYVASRSSAALEDARHALVADLEALRGRLWQGARG